MGDKKHNYLCENIKTNWEVNKYVLITHFLKNKQITTWVGYQNIYMFYNKMFENHFSAHNIFLTSFRLLSLSYYNNTIILFLQVRTLNQYVTPKWK